jgi:hypothetical protein
MLLALKAALGLADAILGTVVGTSVLPADAQWPRAGGRSSSADLLARWARS